MESAGKEVWRRGWSFGFFEMLCTDGWLLIEDRFLGLGRLAGKGAGGEVAMLGVMRRLRIEAGYHTEGDFSFSVSSTGRVQVRME